MYSAQHEDVRSCNPPARHFVSSQAVLDEPIQGCGRRLPQSAQRPRHADHESSIMPAATMVGQSADADGKSGRHASLPAKAGATGLAAPPAMEGATGPAAPSPLWAPLGRRRRWALLGRGMTVHGVQLPSPICM
jgi:hypothetical protein